MKCYLCQSPLRSHRAKEPFLILTLVKIIATSNSAWILAGITSQVILQIPIRQTPSPLGWNSSQKPPKPKHSVFPPSKGGIPHFMINEEWPHYLYPFSFRLIFEFWNNLLHPFLRGDNLHRYMAFECSTGCKKFWFKSMTYVNSTRHMKNTYGFHY